MTDERSRDERAPYRSSEAGAAREPWYERLLHLFSLKAKDSVREDIEEALAETAEDADVSPKERTMLKNVLGLHRVRVDDVMVPRGDIVAVTADITIGQLLGIFRDAGHSRLPVYGETLDDAKGMVHIRDVVSLLATQADASALQPDDQSPGAPARGSQIDLAKTLEETDLVRSVLFAPPSMPAIDLLVRMQATHTHMALVVDEYGGTDGLVTIENLVERVVGDIEDEHDIDQELLVQGEDRTFMADARAKLEEVSEALKVDLLSHDLAEDIDTLGGLITALAGRVPAQGELIAGPSGLEFEVLEADPRRVKRIRIFCPDTTSDRSSVGDEDAPRLPERAPVIPSGPSSGSRSSAA
jgi:CBS domain containing-hemolysin-like protein